jgi:hypothetical protein
MRRLGLLSMGALLGLAVVVSAQSASAYAHAMTRSLLPRVTAISPEHGPTGGGTTVTIRGSNVINATAVDFGSAPATNFTFASAHAITATAPVGTGTVDVTVTTPDGQSPTNSADEFTYVVDTPTIQKISPKSGPTVGGAKVTIIGSDLSGATVVDFGSVPATSLMVNSDQSITAVSPPGALGTVDVTVTTPGGTSPVDPSDQYNYTQRIPKVTSVAPDSGPGAGGTTVTITGAGFSKVTAVDFGSSAATFTVTSQRTITATSPAGSGVVDVTVTTDKGTSATDPPVDQFTYDS